MPDAFDNTGTGPMYPSRRLSAIVPADSGTVPFTIRQIYVGTGGSVSVLDDFGNAVVFVDVPSGAHLGPFEVSRVNATGTTASNLVAYH